MSETPVTTVAIIGGGFCGMMTAVQLCRQSTRHVKIIIINTGYPFTKGVAYNAHTYRYLLNVRAVNMSAFPDEQHHFLDWVCQHPKFNTTAKHLLADVYLPRKVYGEYLHHVWEQTMQAKPAHVTIEQVEGFATDIKKADGVYNIQLASQPGIQADMVVLATGNIQPTDVLANNTAITEGCNYFANPWTEKCVQGIPAGNNVLIVGNGLTMVDTVLGLLENKVSGKIYTVSPNGFLIRSHKAGHPPYPAVLEDLQLDKQSSLHTKFEIIHKHAKNLFDLGLAAQPVIEQLRAYTQPIWMSLTVAEKKAFVRRLSHQWNTVRHRVPMHIHELIQNLRIKNKLEMLKGRLQNVAASADGIAVTIYNKQTKTEQHITVGRIINCTGPASDIHTSANSLLRTLAHKGMIAADELRLGINAHPVTGAIVNADGTTNETLYTLGGSLKGILWESTAVPELRKQAQALAGVIAGKLV